MQSLLIALITWACCTLAPPHEKPIADKANLENYKSEISIPQDSLIIKSTPNTSL